MSPKRRPHSGGSPGHALHSGRISKDCLGGLNATPKTHGTGGSAIHQRQHIAFCTASAELQKECDSSGNVNHLIHESCGTPGACAAAASRGATSMYSL